jgi:uncharacterized membrane protein YczE
MQADPAPPSALSRWRASPSRLTRLLLGLALFGAGEGLVVGSELGNSPWTVFAEGLSVQTALSVGVATVVVSVGILLLWIPLRQRPGLGTILNAIVIGVMIDVTLAALPDLDDVLVRSVVLIGGIALVALGSGFYLGAALGPGPRDGLMTGLHRVTGRAIWMIRTFLEVSALVIGVILGGTFGIGTIAFALLIGPGVHVALRLTGARPAREL